MPRPDPAKRTPLWLQRLRAKDLLQVARQFPDFPIVLETFRECLDDDLDLPRLRAVPRRDPGGTIRVVRAPGGGPLAVHLRADLRVHGGPPLRVGRAEAERPAAARRRWSTRTCSARSCATGSASRWLDPQAIGRVDNRLRGLGHPPRTAEEMAEHLRRLGDLTSAELAGPMAAFLAELQESGRAVTIELTGTTDPLRWILAEDVPLYRAAFPDAIGNRSPRPGGLALCPQTPA